MTVLLSIIHVFVCLFMILVILLQAGKSGGIGMGGGASTVFGGRGSQTVLGKITTVCAAIFMVTSLTLAYFSSRSESTVLQRAREKAAEQKTEAAPAAPAGEQKPAEPAAPAPAPAPAEGAAPAPAPANEAK